MLTLGLTDGITCGAALVQDGMVLAAVNEERLSRLKMAYGFPRQSIAEVFRIAGMKPQEVNLVTAATVNNYFFDGIRPFDGWIQGDKGFVRNAVFSTAGRFSQFLDRIPGLESLYYRARWPIFSTRRRAIRSILKTEFNVTAPVEFIDHHLAHATSAYFTSGFNNAVVVSMDGGGDGLSSRLYIVRGGVFQQVATTSAYHSLGNYYAYITHICGFKAQKHEGKITGLAAHGQPIHLDLLNSMITHQGGQIRNVGGHVFHGAVTMLEASLPNGWDRANLAASIQKHAEDLAVAYVRRHITSDNPKKLALAGGLFANVRINQKMYEIDGVEEIFVHPGMTDGGLAVGAALAPCVRDRQGPAMSWNREVIHDVYYGADFSSREMETAIQDSGLAFSKPESIEAEVAQLLAKGYVVARFNGRMEYGPRALGNRSILYQPADPSVNDWLNERLQRTEFMPFAPSTLHEAAGDCFHNHEGAQESARFMTITFDCTRWMKKMCPGVVHIDGTARPQLVLQEDNPSYYRIINEFRQLTGIPTIINTSFNMHEEPIVCTPDDAIRAFRLGHLDYLAIGDFLVPSPDPIERRLHPMPSVATSGSIASLSPRIEI